MNKEAQRSLWWALSDLGDHFSRLGGAARYPGMPESDIPLFICCGLAQRIEPDFDETEFVTKELAVAAEPVVPKVKDRIDRISASPEEMLELLVHFVEFAEKKLAQHDRSYRWERFVEWVNHATSIHGSSNPESL